MIISFYSYKGGVGRSQLCANIAAYLCFKKCKKVLLWDWDFEAPGLHFFFDKTHADITSSGTIELLTQYSDMMRTKTGISESDYTFFSEDSIISLKVGDAVRGNQGKIDLIPGGNYNENFTYKVNTFNWFEFYELLDGKVYIESLKEWVKNLGYDYILIDSRTGINDYSGICNLQLPDMNVVVMAANEQNISGCKRIIDQISGSEYTKQGFRKPYILPILSRINVNNPVFEKWSDRFKDEFHHLLPLIETNIDAIFSKDVFSVYLEKTLLEDDPRFSAGENLLITHNKQTFTRGSFISKYANISEYICNLLEQGSIGLSGQIDSDTWIEYAEQAIVNEDKNKAAIAYEKANEIDKSIELGGTADAFYIKGNEYISKGDKDKAIECYQKAIEIKPDKHEAFYNMGNAYDAKGDKDKAIECYQKAIEIKPDKYQAFFNMGIAYSAKGDKDKAIECYQKAIEIKPDFHYAFYNMGNAYDGKGDKDKAIECYQKAIEIKPDKHEAFNNMGAAYYAKGDKDKAIESYQKAIEIKLDKHEAFFNMGIVYSDKEDKNKAIECYQKAIEIKLDYHEAFFNMGIAYYDKGDKDKAIECYQKAIEIKPDFHEAFHNMGNAYSAIGDTDKAFECYQKALEIKPDKHGVFNSLGFLYLQIGDLLLAKKHLSQAIEMGSIDLGNMNCGHVYLAQNQELEAIRAYLKSLAAFENKEKFWAGMQDDFQYLKQYGITEERYDTILVQLRKKT